MVRKSMASQNINLNKKFELEKDQSGVFSWQANLRQINLDFGRQAEPRT